jgi:hypothetical protein
MLLIHLLAQLHRLIIKGLAVSRRKFQAVLMRELDIIPLCLWSTDANVGLK